MPILDTGSGACAIGESVDRTRDHARRYAWLEPVPDSGLFFVHSNLEMLKQEHDARSQRQQTGHPDRNGKSE